MFVNSLHSLRSSSNFLSHFVHSSISLAKYFFSGGFIMLHHNNKALYKGRTYFCFFEAKDGSSFRSYDNKPLICNNAIYKQYGNKKGGTTEYQFLVPTDDILPILDEWHRDEYPMPPVIYIALATNNKYTCKCINVNKVSLKYITGPLFPFDMSPTQVIKYKRKRPTNIYIPKKKLK